MAMKVIRIIKSASDIVIPAGITRSIKYGVAHCTAGPQNQSTQEIFNFWKKNNGWTNPGYHFDISADGTIEQYMEISQVANGVKGFNSNSIHFCYKGGIDTKGKPVDNRTDAQKASQLLIINRLKQLFPNIIILGHRDFSRDLNGNGIIESWEWIKSCPAFDVRDWLMRMAVGKVFIPEKIIYKLNTPLIKNEVVENIQDALGIEADGYFGAKTDKAVRLFQASKGLAVDGIVGANTAKLLGVKL